MMGMSLNKKSQGKREDTLLERLEKVVQRCLQFARRWGVPSSNWSWDDWIEEMEAEAKAAGWALLYASPKISDEDLRKRINAVLSRRWKQEKTQGERCIPLETSFDAEEEEKERKDIIDKIAKKQWEEDFWRRTLLEAIEVILTEKEKKVLQLLYWEGLSEREVGEVLGLSQQAVSKTKRMAIRKLQVFLRWGKEKS